MREVGDQFLTKAARKAKCAGKDLPDNPYISSWYGMTIDQLFEKVEGRPLYDGIYRPFSGWHHFDSFYVGTAIKASVGQDLAYRHHDPNIAAQSTAVAIQVLLQTHILLDEHFELGAREDLEVASKSYTAWHEELHGSLKP